MAWAKPIFSKGRIDWAGDILASEPLMVTPELELAEEIVNNWRAIHSYPLQAMKMTLKGRARRICANATIAQRLKRLVSIKLKLKLSAAAGNHPKLSQMQDIGGCRAVMDNVAQVRRLERIFADASKKAPHRGPQYSKTSDYIANPKPNGYRGVHLIYRYKTESPQHSCYNGQRIEIQIRSKLQHYWATAVETYSTFSGQALKSNIGPDEWKRFFALMGSVIALKENSPNVPETPANLVELIPEVRKLHEDLNVRQVLSGWTAGTRFIGNAEAPEYKTAGTYLLVLNPDKFEVSIHPYAKGQLGHANEHYAQIEKNHPELQAVLVSVDSLAALRTAYPNYFLDTTAFLKVVEKAIGSTDA
jgi:hypothetical protein